jgi:hypothetical protein
VAPAYAYSASYCRHYAKQVANDDSNALIILPFMALGAGAGALVGVAVSGLAVSTGAIVGGASGTVVGAVGTSAEWKQSYKEAYDACRAGHVD